MQLDLGGPHRSSDRWILKKKISSSSAADPLPSWEKKVSSKPSVDWTLLKLFFPRKGEGQQRRRRRDSCWIEQNLRA
jgi:hypothetical protein